MNTAGIRYRTMAEPFEEQVERSPNAVALLDENGDTLSYRELNERSNRLAHYLRERGAGPGTRIGICLERGIHQVIAIYAAVKTGAAYIPIDADLPDERIAWMLARLDTSPCADRPTVATSRIPDGTWQIYDVHSDRPPWSGHPVTNLVVDSGPSALLHILYTSGTTGRPKGVASPIAGALANVFWMQQPVPVPTIASTALFKASPGFDISIWEIFWPLYHGARLVICRPGAERDPRHLARLTESTRGVADLPGADDDDGLPGGDISGSSPCSEVGGVRRRADEPADPATRSTPRCPTADSSTRSVRPRPGRSPTTSSTPARPAPSFRSDDRPTTSGSPSWTPTSISSRSARPARRTSAATSAWRRLLAGTGQNRGTIRRRPARPVGITDVPHR